MSWFEYGTPKKRSLRKGVWLRVKHLPEDILRRAKAVMKPDEIIEWVVITEIIPNDKVYLEFWCKERPFNNPLKWSRFAKKLKNNHDFYNRFTVFGFVVDEDPAWICEGDLGRGYK